MSLEDKVLNLLGKGAITWDGLRAQLGANPGDLDGAIRTLERTHSITRDRGRFYLPGAKPVTQQSAMAEASAPAGKVCKGCNELKPLDEFPKHPATKDGRDSNCKPCRAAAAKTRREKKLGQPARLPAHEERPPAPVRSPLADPLMILHFHDGARIGPVYTSDTGLAQMPYHVDLSAAQLDELVTWWTAAKEAA